MGQFRFHWLCLALLLTLGSIWSAPLPETGAGKSSIEGVSAFFILLSVGSVILLVAVILTCVSCCKEPKINFKEFQDHFCEEPDFIPPAEDTPSFHSPAEVYTLSNPSSSYAETCAPPQLARHSLSYIQEIGNGWFGKVLLGEMCTDNGLSKVTVKELKAVATTEEQTEFLKEGKPYCVLQHPNIVQCLGWCVDSIPFLLVYECCEMGDLKTYLRCRERPIPGSAFIDVLQRMACEIAAGIAHLHRHQFVHSDLALRNCFLSKDLVVKLGDYGTGASRYQEDYVIDEDICVPLRWTAPELVMDNRGKLVVGDETKCSNVWSLGVTLWELTENGAQPYIHLSDKEVLIHVLTEQQEKLSKPLLDLPYSDRWYEVMQFCWLPSDKRATAEEIHRLLTYLRAQSQRQYDDEFEQRWNSLKPNTDRLAIVQDPAFPILEQFTADQPSQEMDDILTVTESSRGLSFEYIWEAAKQDHFDDQHLESGDRTLNCHSIFFPSASSEQSAQLIRDHRPEALPGAPGVVPVYDSHKRFAENEHYIQLEDQGESIVGYEEDCSSLATTLHPPEIPLGKIVEHFILRDSDVGESSTDLDLSYENKSVVLNCSEDSEYCKDPISAFHGNIFSDAQKEDSPLNRSLFELHGVSEFMKSVDEGSDLETPMESLVNNNSELECTVDSFYSFANQPVLKFLSSQKLSDNYLFLQENNLLKEPCSNKESNIESSPEHVDDASKLFLDTGFKKDIERLNDSSFIKLTNNNHESCSLSHGYGQCLIQKQENQTATSLVVDLNSSPHLIMGNTDLPSVAVAEGLSNSHQYKPFKRLEEGNAENNVLDLASGNSFTSSMVKYNVSCCQNTTCVHCTESCVAELLNTDAKERSLSKDYLFLEEGRLENERNLVSNDRNVTGDVNSFSKDEGLRTFVQETHNFSIVLDSVPEKNVSILDKSFGTLNLLGNSSSGTFECNVAAELNCQDSSLQSKLVSPVKRPDTDTETQNTVSILNLHSLAESSEAQFSQKLLPPDKPADSGYETENLESPEWTSQLPGSMVSNTVISSAVGGHGEQCFSPLPPNPFIVISESSPRQEYERDDFSLPDKPLNSAHNAYRDSAYFSDNDSELDKKSDDIIDTGGHIETVLVSDEDHGREQISNPEALIGFNDSVYEPKKKLQLEAQFFDELVGDASEVNKSFSEQTELDSMDFPENPFGNVLPYITLHHQGSQIALNKNDTGNSILQYPNESFSDLITNQKSMEGTSESLKASDISLTFETILDKPLSYHSEGIKLKEPDVEGRYLGKLDKSAITDVEDEIDADEEEYSDDSDDGHVNDFDHFSSDSDDGTVHSHPVPVVVMDSDDHINLKSLLKIYKGRALLGTGEEEPEIKKAVSFFDDVTVYLFDQETPTKELSNRSPQANSQVSDYRSPATSSGLSSLHRFTSSDSSTDDEGGGLEWDDDFSCLDTTLVFTAESHSSSKGCPADSSRYSSLDPVPRIPEPKWLQSSYSTFSTSLTHLTDSDIEQGGSGEDGEKD